MFVLVDELHLKSILLTVDLVLRGGLELNSNRLEILCMVLLVGVL